MSSGARELDPVPTLIPSKVQLPQVHDSWLWRARLDELWQEHAHCRLLLACAPTGSGKTAWLAAWADRQDYPVAWYTLDATDNDPRRFGLYLVTSLHQASGQRLPNTLAMARGGGFADLEALWVQLFNEIAPLRTPITVILDDYHLIQDEAIHAAVRLFLRYMPPTLRLAIASRTVPPLGVAQLRVQDHLLEIDCRSLAFTADEAWQFFQQRLRYEISREQAERLNRHVEGWPAALQLAVQSASTRSEFEAFADSLAQGNRYLQDFIEEEALAGLSDELRDFLQQTSLLERFSAGLVETLSEGRYGQAHIEEAERLGLFLLPLDSTRSWYRYHPVFANVLRHQLRIRHPGEEARLHQRAADAWLALDKPEAAARHALAAGDRERIAGILATVGRRFLSQGQFAILQGCLDALPHERIVASPLLTLLQAWTYQVNYQADGAEAVESLLREAETTLTPSCSGEEWQAIEAEFSAVRAQVAMNQGDPEQAVARAQRALAQQPEHMPISRIAACSVLGETCFVQGRLEEAMARMQETERLASADGAHPQVLWTLVQQSEISIAQGLTQKAYNLQERAFQYAEAHQLTRLPVLEFIYRIRAQLLWEWHHLDAAEHCALKGIEILEPQGERRFLQCYTMLARVAQARGQQAICADYVAKLERMLAGASFHLDWAANAHAAMLDYWDAIQDEEAIRRWLSNAPPLTSPSNHFAQCNARNRTRAWLSLGRHDEALALLEELEAAAQGLSLVMDHNRNLIFLALAHWQGERREAALGTLAEALRLATATGALGSFLRLGKRLIVMLKAMLAAGRLGELERHRAERLVQLAQQQRDFGRAIRIHLDEALIQDIIQRPDVPELIRVSPLTRREWQVLGLIHAGLSNEQIAEHLKVAPTTIKTHIRSLYQKLNITQRTEAIALARDLLSKIQGE